MVRRRVAIVQLEVTTLENYLGDVMQELAGRGAQVIGIEPQDPGWQVIRARAAVPALLDLADALGALTHGQASYKSLFSHYELIDEDDGDGRAGASSRVR